MQRLLPILLFAASCGAPAERAQPPASAPRPAPPPEEVPESSVDPTPPALDVLGSPPLDVLGSPPLDQTGPLTLDQALARALSGNPDLLVAQARIDAAAASLGEARAAFLPYLEVGAEYLGADAPSTYLFKSIDAGVFQQGTDFNDPGSFDNLELGVALRWNLYAGGADRARREMAEGAVDIRALEAEVVRDALVASVIATWFDARAAAEQERTARTSAETVQAQLEETRARFEVGTLLESDVLSLEVRLAEAEELVIRAANARGLALAALSNLLGEAADDELELAPMDPPAAPLPEDYELALELALAARPELARARRVVERAERGVDEARAGYLPRADLFARVYGDTPDGLEFERGNWIAGVALTWSLYAGGARAAGVDRARAGLREMLAADRAATLAVQLDVKRAWLRREEARARLEVAGAAVGRAESSLALVRDQYEGGVANVTRYLEAELMATQAKLRATQARYDLRKAQAELARALGGADAGAHNPEVP